MSFYDISKRKCLEPMTVGNLIEELSKFPKETKVYCCGDAVWIHVNSDGYAICIDCDDLENEYEED